MKEKNAHAHYNYNRCGCKAMCIDRNKSEPWLYARMQPLHKHKCDVSRDAGRRRIYEVWRVA
ncbi:hypothetical protein, partial [Klebsiella pneumoniae]|uniref:hypothetical protein n=1 Tax=Klebsiella pneumoniae TaxID=573 RepID=UPI0025A08079